MQQNSAFFKFSYGLNKNYRKRLSYKNHTIRRAFYCKLFNDFHVQETDSTTVHSYLILVSTQKKTTTLQPQKLQYDFYGET